MKKIFLLSFTLASLLLTNYVFAQTFNPVYDIAWIATILSIPQNYLSIPNAIWYLIVPFIAIWAIVLGFLRTLRIFRNSANLEIIIAFVMAFATLPSGIFTVFVSFLLGLSATVAVVAFFGMFILGVILYSLNWGGSLREVAGHERELRRLRDRMREIDRQIPRLNPQTQQNLINTLDAERDAIKNRINILSAQENQVRSQRAERYE